MPQQQPGGDGAQLNPLIAPRSGTAAAAPPPQRPANPFVAAAAVEQPAGASGFAALLNEMSAASRIATKLRQKATTGASSEFATSMDSTPGIPVREMMTQVFVHERARSAKEFALYFLYVCIFSCCVWQITDTNVRVACARGLRAPPGRLPPYVHLLVRRCPRCTPTRVLLCRPST